MARPWIQHKKYNQGMTTDNISVREKTVLAVLSSEEEKWELCKQNKLRAKTQCWSKTESRVECSLVWVSTPQRVPTGRRSGACG